MELFKEYDFQGMLSRSGLLNVINDRESIVCVW